MFINIVKNGNTTVAPGTLAPQRHLLPCDTCSPTTLALRIVGGVGASLSEGEGVDEDEDVGVGEGETESEFWF
jgi:hypothetical protein